MSQKETWVAVASLVLGVFLAVASGAYFSGGLEARVKALEDISSKSVSRGEWEQFTQDMKDRLGRIENKLDGKESK